MNYQSVIKRARKLVDGFRKCGIELIVFFDANICTNKLDTWLSRRAERVNKVYAIHNKIKCDGSINGFRDFWFAVQ